MVRMRLISEAYQEIKEADPNTALTMCALRRIVLSGAIPTICSGRKRFINMDALLDYLSGTRTAEVVPTFDEVGEIRPIQV